MEIREKLKNKILGVLEELNIEEKDVNFTSDISHGDFSTNISLTVFHKLKEKFKNPIELGKFIVSQIQKNVPEIERIEISPPGFLNFFLREIFLIKKVDHITSDKNYGKGSGLQGHKILLEFAHPNTHKLFHIGHLRNISVGESLARLLDFQGSKVIRANYQGDIGLHVAKAIYGIQNSEFRIQNFGKKSIKERIKFISNAYVEGNKAFEEDEGAKTRISELNKKLYEKDPDLMQVWEITRKWSLEYFDRIYKRLGTKFDRLYFESEAAEPGREIVLKNVGKVFVKDDGAVIFEGEKCGLHNRVFINSIGLPTYEGKDVGLAHLQMKEFSPDKIIHVVGPEQKGYFDVLFKALEEVSADFKNKELHLEYGFVRLKEGKMSSRRGDVVEGEWLLDETKRRLKENFEQMKEETLGKVAVGAVKYSMLKFSRKSDITFSFKESINLEGNSGPYIQYAYARTNSVLAKVKSEKLKVKSKIKNSKLEKEELLLLRLLIQFPQVVREAQENFAPNTLANYLFELSQAFNNFYQKHKIIGSENQDFRLNLTSAVGKTLKTGLYLLGIEAPNKM